METEGNFDKDIMMSKFFRSLMKHMFENNNPEVKCYFKLDGDENQPQVELSIRLVSIDGVAVPTEANND